MPQPQRIFLVDVEASGRSSFSGVMTEFGVVDFATRDWFHGRLWIARPHPETPVVPVPVERAAAVRISAPHIEPRDAMTDSGWPTVFAPRGEHDETLVYSLLRSWLAERCAGERAVLVSDNPGFDAMWMAEAFDRNHMENPFGHSSRRIGDLAAGLSGKWRNTSAWKRHRRTRHDHNPVNDALGNAEALAHVLREAGQVE